MAAGLTVRLVEATFPDSQHDAVKRAAEAAKPIHWRIGGADENDVRTLHALFGDGGAQGLIDDLHNAFEGRNDWRIIVLPVEATAPTLEEAEQEPDKERKKTLAIREEIYEDVAKGAVLSTDFLLLTALSTVVAAIGLNADNVAAVVGAMVIAPLLGPVLAFSLAAGLGDLQLLQRSARNAFAGVAVGVALAALMGTFLKLHMDSHELMSRTTVGLDSVALALASGAAAALSVTTGASSALVGVMVAVALLPPAAAAGLFFGAGEIGLAGRALLLLSINVVCVVLAAQAVYLYKGVRPRTWLERKAAKRSGAINAAVLAGFLLILVTIVVLAPDRLRDLTAG